MTFSNRPFIFKFGRSEKHSSGFFFRFDTVTQWEILLKFLIECLERCLLIYCLSEIDFFVLNWIILLRWRICLTHGKMRNFHKNFCWSSYSIRVHWNVKMTEISHIIWWFQMKFNIWIRFNMFVNSIYGSVIILQNIVVCLKCTHIN